MIESGSSFPSSPLLLFFFFKLLQLAHTHIDSYSLQNTLDKKRYILKLILNSLKHQSSVLRIPGWLELTALTDLWSRSSPCSYFINGKRGKQPSLSWNNCLYYCVPAERSEVTDSSFGERGWVSISFSLRRTEVVHVQRRAQNPASTTLIPPGPNTKNKPAVFHSPDAYSKIHFLILFFCPTVILNF